jgi:hypothetical protein
MILHDTIDIQKREDANRCGSYVELVVLNYNFNEFRQHFKLTRATFETMMTQVYPFYTLVGLMYYRDTFPNMILNHIIVLLLFLLKQKRVFETCETYVTQVSN